MSSSTGDVAHTSSTETPSTSVRNRKNQSNVNRTIAETIGKTANGIEFAVPESHDMIHTLLDPRLRKSPIDYATVVVLLSYVWLYWVLPSNWRTPVLFLLFAFWRCAYNLGIGRLLEVQSNKRQLVEWCKQYKLLDKPFIQHDLKLRLQDLTEAEIEKLPIEYKTWVLFRHFVDLILMSDFVSYCLLAISCFHSTQHPWYIVVGRWLAGLTLILFNLWVKIDAHRVVKDFAWYWGDFFFLEEVNLVFDGVFEMAPHPMYSIGYAAYYGISLITSSFTLFTASVLAHALQFYFLVKVENPHIEKTYGPSSTPQQDQQALEITTKEFTRPTPLAMLLLWNFNFTRPSDSALVALVISTCLLVFPHGKSTTLLTLILAITWRLVHTIGLGSLLRRQSYDQHWTKLCMKYGSTPLEAYQKWQEMYNITTVMSYTSLFVLAIREYSSPLNVPFWPFRYIIGSMLIVLQIWTAHSVYEQLGDYGWFFGDFFYLKDQMNFTVSGIYRYLNHPDRFFGIAGIIGISAICCSSIVTFVAFVWLFSNLAFLQFVEKPHIRKLYGDQTMRESGVQKNVRKAQQFFQNTILDPDYVETILYDFWAAKVAPHAEKLAQLRPVADGVVGDTKKLLRQYPAAATKILSENIEGKDLTGYSLTTEKSQYNLGETITVEWTAGTKFPRTPRDWVGIYRVGDNGDTKITSKSSTARWSGVEPGQYPMQETKTTCDGNKGTIKFEGKLLFWEPGQYEFRYHRNAKHNVIHISKPIEIQVTKEDPKDERPGEVAASILSLYGRCGGNSELAGLGTPLDLRDNEILARLTEGIKAVYGVELAPFVIQTDSTAQRIADRIRDVAIALDAFKKNTFAQE